MPIMHRRCLPRPSPKIRETRPSERLANYEQQTHEDVRHAEELKAAADDLLGRLEQ
jgi:hypothetical protein